MTQDLLRFTKEDSSRCRKLNGSLRPVEELDAKLLFQVEDGLANRGLRHVQTTRRLAVVQVMRNADKVTQMAKLHNFTLIAESDYYKRIIRFPRWQEWSDKRTCMNMNTILSPTANPRKSLRDIALDLPGEFPIARWAPIPLRLIVGFGFMEHGFAKLSKGPDALGAILHALAVPAPHFVAWITILTELLGGLSILLGAFVSLVSLPMAALLLVAIFTVHLPYGFSSIKLMAVTASGAQFGPPGYECDLLYLACLAALVLGGSGPLAVDGLLRKDKLNLNNFKAVTTNQNCQEK